jgi:hypothetical protein
MLGLFRRHNWSGFGIPNRDHFWYPKLAPLDTRTTWGAKNDYQNGFALWVPSSSVFCFRKRHLKRTRKRPRNVPKRSLLACPVASLPPCQRAPPRPPPAHAPPRATLLPSPWQPQPAPAGTRQPSFPPPTPGPSSSAAGPQRRQARSQRGRVRGPPRTAEKAEGGGQEDGHGGGGASARRRVSRRRCRTSLPPQRQVCGQSLPPRLARRCAYTDER